MTIVSPMSQAASAEEDSLTGSRGEMMDNRSTVECPICKQLQDDVQRAEMAYDAADQMFDEYIRAAIHRALPYESAEESRGLQIQLYATGASLDNANLKRDEHEARCGPESSR
jgi:hypothetical protein